MQLLQLLNEGWKGKVGIVAISWTEGCYGYVPEARLQRMVGEFHPDIRVNRETPRFSGDFAPLDYVPANFLFDKNGKRIFGDGSREYLSKERLTALLEKMS